MVKKFLLALLLFSGIAVFPSLVKAEEMAELKVGTTLENFQAAFNRESNDHARYLAFAQKADEEDYDRVANLFRAFAQGEQFRLEHYAAIIKALGAEPEATIEIPVVKTTKENLQTANESALYESTKMYPAFLAKAKEEKNSNAIELFEYAEKGEGRNAHWCEVALSAYLVDLKGQLKMNFWVCPKCGGYIDPIPGLTEFVCPVCHGDTRNFIKVN